MKLFQPFVRLFPLAALVLALASCNKVNDLLDPKSGDDKLEDLLTAGTWKVDTLVLGHIDNGTTVLDSAQVGYGTLVFSKRSKESGSNYGVGLVQHTHPFTDTLGTRSVVDTMFWYAGNWGSIDIEGKVVTLFMRKLNDGSFDDQSDLHLDFLERTDKRICLDGRRAYTNLGNGYVYGPYRRFRLSR